MKTFIVTSTLTFVPENYNHFILPMAKHPHVAGLILIENRHFNYLLKALLLILSGAAPRMGFTLIKNYFSKTTDMKIKTFEMAGKKIFMIDDINAESTLEILRQEKVELILNARTRSFFKKALLATPTIGCINIHHGLLPDQRGLMCDFWAHLENTAFGFSVHQMTSKLDDGQILVANEVRTEQLNYLNSIEYGSRQEAIVCTNLLNKIAAENNIVGKPNTKTEQTKYRKNPGLLDFYKMKLKGIKT